MEQQEVWTACVPYRREIKHRMFLPLHLLFKLHLLKQGQEWIVSAASLWYFGMIGAPLMSEYVDQVGVDRSQRAVFGVNVYTGSLYNYGPRINHDRFVDWMRQTGYNPILYN